MDETTRWASGGAPFASSSVDHLRRQLDVMDAIKREANPLVGEPDERTVGAIAERVKARMDTSAGGLNRGDVPPRDPRNRKARRAAQFGRGGAR